MSALDRIRRPEYTGENRCMACTYVNALLTVLFTAALVAIGAQLLGLVPALAVGAAFAVLASASIWLRGYLVPKTPTLTKRYMPDRMLRAFGKAPPVGPGGSAAAENPFEDSVGDPDGAAETEQERLLLDAGAVEPCEDGTDLCLTEAFGEAWSAALTDVPEDPDPSVAAVEVGFDAEAIGVRQYGEGTVVTENSRRIFEWPSTPAKRLDVAGARILADELPAWAGLTPPQRAALVNGLRVFAEECPDGSEATLSEEVVESCCTSHTVVVLECADSGDRLFEWRTD
ncbi:hypothetical protein [Salinarchaeum laminariae]|uniref:hypothetical protein n=1 Tax=Salinarchaeum laminariae TaxID=869888 RepID=UPI0020BF24A2|nr:hypothetical protein [Salinarchaeum laminariae]